MTQLRSLLEKKGFYRIPLKKLNSGHYKFTASINGKKGSFILDTGASTSCIGFESVSYFAMKSEESSIKAAGAGAINMLTEVTWNNTFTIGSWTLNKMSFIIFDLSHVNEALSQVEEEVVHGIIGADFLKEVRAVIDYGRNALYVK
ncbi:retropepsin-like aspartic protease family protein [Constantimarinum furrinae]|uniref:Aspartyl protease n=1 Tax=Constantimarinum furrinae TaxID=2562285 RepID=A0A7G8PTS2_9FLAO|nr:retropepsin-like aspartic protease [Constantimarinum furrinae]QNJ97738.1 Aspartyl protease [Constantimarinum furrinae]